MIVQADSLVGNLWEHLGIGGTGFVVGATAMRFARDTIAYAISTFPEPQSVTGKWFLGIMKFIVGEAKQLAPDKEVAATSGQ